MKYSKGNAGRAGAIRRQRTGRNLLKFMKILKQKKRRKQIQGEEKQNSFGRTNPVVGQKEFCGEGTGKTGVTAAPRAKYELSASGLFSFSGSVPPVF